MNKSIILVLVIFAAILGFLLANTFLSSVKQPKIVVTTPKVVIEQPAPKVTKQVIVKTVVIRPKVKPQKGLLKKVTNLLTGSK